MFYRVTVFYVSKLVVVISMLFTLPALAKQAPTIVIDSNYKRLNISGVNKFNGVYDIAVEYGANGIGWMVYSRVRLPQYVETHLARSLDRGKTWHYVRALNKSHYQTIYARGRQFNGVWRYETPTLVYDPSDKPSRRWKYYVHRYYSLPPHKPNTSLFTEGWIEYSYAASPDGQWSRPQRLFGKPRSRSRINISDLHPSLKNMKFFNEMGSISHKGRLYLSFDASPTRSGLGQWRKRKVILISSGDHGHTWRYVGVLANFSDAKKFGYLTLTGSSLVKVKGRLYLFITPSGARGLLKKNRGHDGTIIVPFKNIKKARLHRDLSGKLKAVKILKPGKTNGGLSDYHEKNTAGGILFSQINVKSPPQVFTVYSTGVKIRR